MTPTDPSSTSTPLRYLERSQVSRRLVPPILKSDLRRRSIALASAFACAAPHPPSAPSHGTPTCPPRPFLLSSFIRTGIAPALPVRRARHLAKGTHVRREQRHVLEQHTPLARVDPKRQRRRKAQVCLLGHHMHRRLRRVRIRVVPARRVRVILGVKSGSWSA